MDLITHAQEIEFIQWMHQFRSAFSDLFFIFLNFFDRFEFFFILIPLVWLNYGWKAGFRLSFVLLLNVIVNKTLKSFFASPRPFHMNPHIAILQLPGLGFPSGAAQTVILLSGLLLRYWENSWKWLLAALYVLFISFSRIYLGVHFPTDVLGGWLVGFGLLLIYFWTAPPIERRLKKWSPFSLFLLSQTVPLLLLLCYHYLMRMSAVFMGMGLGLFVMHSYHLFLMPPKSNKEYLYRALLGILGTFLLYILTGFLPYAETDIFLFVRFFLIGLWVSLGSPLICMRMRVRLGLSMSDIEKK